MVRPAWAIGCRGVGPPAHPDAIVPCLQRCKGSVPVWNRQALFSIRPPQGELTVAGSLVGSVCGCRQAGRRRLAAGDTIAPGTPPRPCRGEWRPRAAGRLTRRRPVWSRARSRQQSRRESYGRGSFFGFPGTAGTCFDRSGNGRYPAGDDGGGLGFRRVKGAPGWPAGFGERWPGAGWSWS